MMNIKPALLLLFCFRHTSFAQAPERSFGDLREVDLLVEAGFTPLEAIKFALP